MFIRTKLTKKVLTIVCHLANWIGNRKTYPHKDTDNWSHCCSNC